MSDDIVFKFVSLRAPVGANVSGLLAIEAEGDDAGSFLSILWSISAATPRERLRLAANHVVNSDLYLLNDTLWRANFGSAEIEALVEEAGADLGRFRNLADSLLKKIILKEDERLKGWETNALRQRFWASYIASLFAPGDRGRETRFFLSLLRIVFAVRQSSAAGFDPASLQLSKRRIALPARLFAGPMTPTAPNPQRPPTAAQADLKHLTDDINAFQHALKTLDQAKAKKHAKLIEQSLKHKQVPAPAAANKAKIPDKPGFILFSLAEAPAGSSLQHLTSEELGDPKVAKTLADLGLDPSAGIAAVRGKLVEVIGARVAELGRSQTREMVSWEHGAFVRLRRPAVRNQGGKT